MSDAEAYDWSQFHVRMYYLASMEEVFARFSTSSGLESFFLFQARHVTSAGQIRGSDEQIQAGDRYGWEYVHDYRHGGEFLNVITNEVIEFTFGSMHIAISFKPVGEAIEVDLHQTQCATEDPDRAWQHVNCRSCWILPICERFWRAVPMYETLSTQTGMIQSVLGSFRVDR